MSIYDLGAAASDREVIVTIPKEYDNYFVAWYQATKKDGENPENFALRILGKEAIRWFRNKRITELNRDNGTIEMNAGDDEDQFLTANNL